MHTNADTWAALPGWIERSVDAGECFALSDLLIASMASEIGALVWSLDKDFDRMAALGFISLYPGPAS